MTISGVDHAALRQRFLTARLAAGLTQEDVAAKMQEHGGPRTRTVQAIEGGQTTDPRATTLFAFCKETGVTADWLLGLSDAGGPDNQEAAEAAARAISAAEDAQRTLAEQSPPAPSSPPPSRDGRRRSQRGKAAG